MTPREAVTYVVGGTWLIGLAALTLVTASSPTPAPRRVAIRAHCDDCTVVERLAVDTWTEHREIGEPIDVVVFDRDLAELTRAGIHYDVLVDDIDAVARAEAERLANAPLVAASAQPADWYREYKDYRAVSARLEEIAASAPALTSLEPIGASIEGRALWALRIGSGPTPMLLNGTQHAREWISTMVTTCVAERLVRGYTTDARIRDFVDSTELWVVPIVNPDGYQYSWAGNRYWRKNRRGTHGVDLNRNWDLGWGGPGSSGSKRSDVYRGESPFSEPETAALRDLVKRERIAIHVDFHAFSQLLLYPWGHISDPAPDEGLYRAVGDRMASAMFAKHQKAYKLMASIELYAAGGVMSDWMYGKAGAFSYTIELRPSRGGRSGFVLPPEQIAPTCDEGLAAVLELRKAR